MPESPSYYLNAARGGSIIDFAERLNYHRGRALALIFRAGRKPGRSAIDDLEAARDHLNAEIARMRTDGMEVPKDPADEGNRIAHEHSGKMPGWEYLAQTCPTCTHPGHAGFCGYPSLTMGQPPCDCTVFAYDGERAKPNPFGSEMGKKVAEAVMKTAEDAVNSLISPESVSAAFKSFLMPPKSVRCKCGHPGHLSGLCNSPVAGGKFCGCAVSS